jgi:hypothetical protein
VVIGLDPVGPVTDLPIEHNFDGRLITGAPEILGSRLGRRHPGAVDAGLDQPVAHLCVFGVVKSNILVVAW